MLNENLIVFQEWVLDSLDHCSCCPGRRAEGPGYIFVIVIISQYVRVIVFFCFFFIGQKVRVIVSAQHTDEDIQKALGHFKDAKQFLTNV